MNYNQIRQYERFQMALDYLGGCCVVCGTSNNLQFDHIDPTTKLFTISTHLKAKLSKLMSELDKCQLLCKDHHIEKTIQESNAKRTHGKQWMALKLKCKCDICLHFIKEYNSLRRKKRSITERTERICGTYAMYKHGCRCSQCKHANSEYMKNLRARSLSLNGRTTD